MRLKYSEITEGTNYDEDYMRQVGADLFKKLSKVLEQKVSKANFKDILEFQASTHLLARQQSHTEESLVALPSFENLELPLQRNHKRVLQRAAILTGLPLNDYIIHYALLAAREHLSLQDEDEDS